MRNPFVPIPMTVERNRVETVDGGIRTLTLSFPADADRGAFDFVPGQFAELSILGVGEAPFGIASSPAEGGLLDFTISRVGRVTTALHHLEPGESVGLRGPLGNGYPMSELEGGDLLLAGGGFGFSTLRALARFVLKQSNRSRFGDITVVFGARSPGLLLYRDDLEEWGERRDVRLAVTVDRGDGSWTGLTGTVPDALRRLDIDAGRTTALVCGPPAMIRHTIPVLAGLGVAPERTHVSLEMKMKCGIGKCGRCSIGGRYVCTDGPVFRLADLENLPGEFR
ncbi:heterodisulfide reductase subunit F [Candidatus Fermentibacteria bacterium]|nr:heterodisulfide reductase subunit F [Candidatus Fermentibacteria bacterium]